MSFLRSLVVYKSTFMSARPVIRCCYDQKFISKFCNAYFQLGRYWKQLYDHTSFSSVHWGNFSCLVPITSSEWLLEFSTFCFAEVDLDAWLGTWQLPPLHQFDLEIDLLFWWGTDAFYAVNSCQCKIDFSLHTYIYFHRINKHTIQGCTLPILWFEVYD